MKRVDVVDRIFGIAAIRGKSVMAMACSEVAIIETDGVETPETVGTDATALVRFDSDPVSNGEAYCPISQSGDRRGIFMTRDKFAKRGLVLPPMGQYFRIRSADGAGLHLEEHLLEARFWDLLLDHPQIIGSEQDRCLHLFRDVHRLLTFH
jgi:hypothetical protein